MESMHNNKKTPGAFVGGLVRKLSLDLILKFTVVIVGEVIGVLKGSSHLW